VLKRIDSFLAWLSWVAAALLVVMLFVGPKIIANDKANPTGAAAGAAPYARGSGGGGRPDAKSLFTGNCGACHTLQAAGTSGQVGPGLDGISLSAGDIAAKVRAGGGGMPAFAGKLSDAEISAVASFVAAQR
jgi:mono/diheme cytochrome c family protein